MNPVAYQFSRAAKHYDACADLQRSCGEQLFKELLNYALKPHTIVDLGCGTGYFSQRLVNQFQPQQMIALDLAQDMLVYLRQQRYLAGMSLVCADANNLPLANGSVDFLFANFMLQWCHSLADGLRQIRASLAAPATFAFTLFTQETLTELRQSWAAIDGNVHVNSFVTEQECLSLLKQLGFEVVFSQTQLYTRYYANLHGLISELRNLGANHVMHRSYKGLLTPRHWQQLIANYPGRGKETVPASFAVLSVIAKVGTANAEQ